MKKIFTLFAATLFFALNTHAQVFTQGDVSVTPHGSATHDSTGCSSTVQIYYDIVVQNSFIGDSVKIIAVINGQFIYAAGNTTGQSPWSFSTPVISTAIKMDYMVSGGNIHFDNNTYKVISGPDTIPSVLNVFDLAVTNPCEYDSVKGRVYADINANCVFDSSDFPLSGISVEAPGTFRSGWTFGFQDLTTSQGNFGDIYQKSWLISYRVHLGPGYDFIFPAQSCSPRVYYLTTVPQDTLDFPLLCSALTDVQCFIGTPPTVRPLIPFYLRPVVNNIGCVAASGTMRLVLDPRVTYNAGLSTNPATSVSGDTLKWNYSNLSNLTNGSYWRSFFAGVHLTPAGTVNIGDTLCFELFTNVPGTDVNAANNYTIVCLPVVNSFDPNEKEVQPKGEGVPGYIPISTTELTYIVHFQNTGTAPAYIVTIKDTLSDNIDRSSLQIIGASHTMTPKWNNDSCVQFSFLNINLPDSNSNEPKSHGFVAYKVKLKPGLANGTQIKNTAAIYFDNNPPIFTNTALNTIGIPTDISEVNGFHPVKIFPNPSNGEVTVLLNEAEENFSVRIISVTGATILSKTNLSGNSFTFNMAEQAGLYFVELNLNGSVSRVKLVRSF